MMFRALMVIVTLSIFIPTAARATTHEFYKGKTVRLIVGFPAGGGFDTYARVLARHVGKHIPGNPAIVVENMAGAGSMIGANHVFKVAKPDGLTIGHFHGGLFLQQVLGRQGIEFEPGRFGFIGAPVTDKAACALTRASGVTRYGNMAGGENSGEIGRDRSRHSRL